MRKGSIPVFEGQKFGIIRVGPLVEWVFDHALYSETPLSYLKHGRLRECTCECGKTRLYSENVLSSGQLKSCGCLRLKRQERAMEDRAEREKAKSHLRDIRHRISQAQSRLRFLQSKPAHMRTVDENLEIVALGPELRKLFAMKGHASRKV